MAAVEYQHLVSPEIAFLDHAVGDGRITSLDLPLGISVGLDSMGPARDSKTDALFPGMRETLYRFRDTLRRYDLTLVVATNGPDKEGVDILEAVNPNHQDPIRAWAIPEGGGRLITRSRDHIGWEYTNLANEEEVTMLENITRRAAARSKLMEALLTDTEPDDRDAPIRTPYHTNTVLTFPNVLDTLRARLIAKEVNLEAELPGINPQSYLDMALGYAATNLAEAIAELGLSGSFTQVTKKQNRRHYVIPAHLLDGTDLSKIGGAALGARILYSVLGKEAGITGYDREYQIGNSIYIADKAIDVTGEGQTVLGSSERSMIVGSTYFVGDPPRGMKIVKMYASWQGIGSDGEDVHIADVGTRLAIDVTMDEKPPKLTSVEGIKVLHIGSGGKALEAVTHLYDILYQAA